ncbi:GNAT family N-acetyltransferase [Leuconostoc miyukkimchii]|uniref:GNAT family N-acetyltransferase n=1 Tax=Leuconostoc miyukkimchii TaxID=910540 RepID=UPI001C7D341B|nr:GNAT family N-acetyltransferase [Leuconostoc miyukkimchii]
MLKLTVMDTNHFKKYINTAVQEYATEKEAAGTWLKVDALKNAQDTYDRLLPLGLETPHNFFYTILDDTTIVGYVWFGADNENESVAFIFDFEIYAPYQNKGFGSGALDLVTPEAKEKGFTSLGLHVFGSNTRAIHVYEKSGFKITDVKMKKDI